jgi:hypothetical protein
VARVYTLMHGKGTDDPLYIAKAWSRFALLEQFEYRAQLNAFSGRNWIAPEWEVECWKNKVVLRREWEAIEWSGKAGEWIKGVGMNGGSFGFKPAQNGSTSNRSIGPVLPRAQTFGPNHVTTRHCVTSNVLQYCASVHLVSVFPLSRAWLRNV